jgi:hypothetical protein
MYSSSNHVTDMVCKDSETGEKWSQPWCWFAKAAHGLIFNSWRVGEVEAL